jgi:hypothetical protein
MSYKKVLGTIGCGVFFFVCIKEMFTVEPNVSIVLYSLGGLIIALFGLKGYFGNKSKQIQNGGAHE